jgi:hypothetical protein
MRDFEPLHIMPMDMQVRSDRDRAVYSMSGAVRANARVMPASAFANRTSALMPDYSDWPHIVQGLESISLCSGDNSGSTLIERVGHDPLPDERIGNCLPLAPREPRL